MIKIEKFQNGKLYNVSDKVYITLNEIRELTKKTVELQVRDSESGSDITASVLMDVIHEHQQKSGSLPISRLRGIIKNGTLSEYFEWLDSQR